MVIFQWLKKIYRFIFISVIIIGVFVTVLSAFKYLTASDKIPLYQSTNAPYKSAFEKFNQTVDSSDKSAKEKEQTKKSFSAAMCFAVGEGCEESTSKKEDQNNSFVGGVSGLIALPFKHPPASGISYAMYKLQDNDFIPDTYAYEGVGLASIRGYMEVWKVFRNFSYLFIVLFIILLGFMVMFRWNLGGETLVTMENVLPRIVITLILITFSFPIAGALIDALYVSIGLFVYLLSTTFSSFSTDPVDKATLVNDYLGAGFGKLWPYEGKSSAMAAGSALYYVLPGIMQNGLSVILGGVVNLLIVRTYNWKFEKGAKTLTGIGAGILGNNIFTGNIATVISFIVELILAGLIAKAIGGAAFIMGVIILFTLLFFMFRIFFVLLTAYIKIILLIIFAPLILLFQILPGKNAFGWWFKSLFGELLTFLIVVVIVLTGYIIVGINQAQDTAFKLPFLHNGFTTKDFGSIIGLGIILMIPDLIKLAKALLGIPELGINFSAGMFFAGASAPLGGVQSGMGIFGSLQQVAHLPFMEGKLGPLKGLMGPTTAEVQRNILNEFMDAKPGTPLHKPKPAGGGGDAHGGDH